MLNGDEAIFILDSGSGVSRIVLTTLTMLKSSGPDRRPLWWYQPRSNKEAGALMIWFGEQRALWPTWQKIAERDGIDAVGRELARLWSLEPIEACSSLMITPGDDPSDLSIAALLVNRSSAIVQHRFESGEHRQAFLEWYLADIDAGSTFILTRGCLISPSHLQDVMNTIASAEIATSSETRRSRASAVAPRKAA